ncbi:MAG TPA: ImmA/IrrE family metallo-endopeptidase [Verrucomicrobiales bacterium]|nr:ImmA/IrrE family metallo-endopeptidase [Verrucomicrobiales bacterium]
MITDEERLASQILEDFEIKRTPVNVFEIARREKIKLCPTSAGLDFCGRLEFAHDLGRFLLFHPDTSDAEENPRIRFSVGHELGHYYIETHREHLIGGGNAHSSSAGFICDKKMELQADAFAAGLLIPERTLKSRMAMRRDGFLTLKELLRLAEECKASRESAAIRYVKYTEEKCIAVVSREETVLYAASSDDAERIKLLVKRGATVPSHSAAMRTQRGEIVENEIDGAEWVPWTRVRKLSEESISLGYGGLALTLLAYVET